MAILAAFGIVGAIMGMWGAKHASAPGHYRRPSKFDNAI